jgi:hypothetical protein
MEEYMQNKDVERRKGYLERVKEERKKKFRTDKKAKQIEAKE